MSLVIVPTLESPDAASEPFLTGKPGRTVLGGVTRLLGLYHRAEVRGLEALPRGRPLIFVAKHPRTWLYTETLVLVGRVSLAPGLAPVRTLQRLDGALPLLGWWRRQAGGIPASPDAALAALRRGESLLVFPGGTRELAGPRDAIQWRGRRGYARLAALTGTPVVPVAMHGADRQHPLFLRLGERGVIWLPPWPLPVKLVLELGAPLAPPERADGAAVAAFSERVAHATRQLLAASRRRRRR